LNIKRLALLPIIFAPALHAFASTGNGWTVGVIDSGFNKNYTKGRATRSACLSERTSFNTTGGNYSSYKQTIYYFNILSKCLNDNSSDAGSGSKAKTMPRSKQTYTYTGYASRFQEDMYKSYYSNHGTNVLDQVLKSAPSANTFLITIGSFKGEPTGNNTNLNDIRCSGSSYRDEWKNDIPNYRHLVRYYTKTDCKESIKPVQIRDSVNYLASFASGMASVNISLGADNQGYCNSRLYKSNFQRLVDRGVIPVAATGNSSGGNVEFPACLSNVVAVAQTKNGVPTGSSLNGSQVDYFAEVSGTEVTGNRTLRGTSFAAPLVAGAFAAMKSANPNATASQLKRVLHETGTPVSGYTARRINVARAIREIIRVNPEPPTPPPPTTPPPTTPPPTTPEPQPPTPPGQTAVLGFTDNTLYSSLDYPNDPARTVRLAINLNGSTSASTNTNVSIEPLANPNIGISNVRDIKISFNGLFKSRRLPQNVSGVDIWVNGTQRINFNSTQYIPTGNLHFKKHSFILNRNWLRSGDNEILIKPRIWSEIGWRVTDIRMDYNSPIKMRLGQKITKLYGHRVGSKKHLTGLRVEFDSPSKDIEFSATGFDIDSSTEIAVFLNQKRIGYLKRGSSSRYNAGDVFKLRKEDFVISGVNTIEFVQTSSSDRETWGVTNMELSDVQVPNITVLEVS